MNHPTIISGAAQARYNELLREAEEYRLARKVARAQRINKIVNTIVNLFI